MADCYRNTHFNAYLMDSSVDSSPCCGAVRKPGLNKAGCVRAFGRTPPLLHEAHFGKDSRPRAQPVLAPRPSTLQTKEPLGRLRPARSTWGRGGGRAPAATSAAARAALSAAPPGWRAPRGKPRLVRKAPGSGRPKRRVGREAPGSRPASLSPARGRCPGRDTAPSPQLRRSRVSITLPSGSRRGAILSPAAAARPRPPPGRGLPAPASPAPPA